MLAHVSDTTVATYVEMGEHIPADATGLTAVPGVWVAGNVVDLTAPVAGAVESGVRAAAAINADLIAEDTRHAVATHRARLSLSWRGTPA
jgi:thioredoxin reductase